MSKVSPIVVSTKRGIVPVSQYDAEIIEAAGFGVEYDMKPRSKRSIQHDRLYRKMLARIVEATGKWPTADHLHHDLKLTCGYVTKARNLSTGEIIEVVDSIAHNKMTRAEFMVYFENAVAVLANELGCDPMIFLD